MTTILVLTTILLLLLLLVAIVLLLRLLRMPAIPMLLLLTRIRLLVRLSTILLLLLRSVLRLCLVVILGTEWVRPERYSLSASRGGRRLTRCERHVFEANRRVYGSMQICKSVRHLGHTCTPRAPHNRLNIYDFRRDMA